MKTKFLRAVKRYYRLFISGIIYICTILHDIVPKSFLYCQETARNFVSHLGPSRPPSLPLFPLEESPVSARLPPLFRILVTRVPGLPEMFYIRSIFTRYYDNTSIRADRSLVALTYCFLTSLQTRHSIINHNNQSSHSVRDT